MKRGVLLLTLLLSGCFTTGSQHNLVLRKREPAPVPVSADGLSTTNAHDRAQALWEEMDREENRNLLEAQKPATPAKK